MISEGREGVSCKTKRFTVKLKRFTVKFAQNNDNNTIVFQFVESQLEGQVHLTLTEDQKSAFDAIQ